LTPLQVLEKEKNETSFNYKVRAIVTLGFSGDHNAIEPLLTCLASEDDGIRGWAAFSLGELISEIHCTSADIQPIRYALIGEKDPTVRTAIEAALEKIEKSNNTKRLSEPHYLVNKIKIKKPEPLYIFKVSDEFSF